MNLDVQLSGCIANNTYILERREYFRTKLITPEIRSVCPDRVNYKKNMVFGSCAHRLTQILFQDKIQNLFDMWAHLLFRFIKFGPTIMHFVGIYPDVNGTFPLFSLFPLSFKSTRSNLSVSIYQPLIIPYYLFLLKARDHISPFSVYPVFNRQEFCFNRIEFSTPSEKDKNTLPHIIFFGQKYPYSILLPPSVVIVEIDLKRSIKYNQWFIFFYTPSRKHRSRTLT